MSRVASAKIKEVVIEKFFVKYPDPSSVVKPAKAADVFLKLRLNTDTHAELSVGACRVWENGGYKSTEMTCRVGIENYSKSVEVNATGNRYTKTFFVLGYMDDLGL